MSARERATAGVVAALCLALLGGACTSARAPASTVYRGAVARVEPEPEATSLLGPPLLAAPLADAARTEQESHLAAARARLDANPGDLDAWIWVGRRTAYLGRYREAIEVYSRALERFPEAPELYRHRGHRWLSVRELDRAVADL